MSDIKLIKGDCLEAMKDISDKSIDMIAIDPPYKLTSGGRKNTKFKVSAEFEKGMKSGKIFEHNEIKSSDWFKELYRVLKDGTHCYVMCNDKYVREYIVEAENVGFKEVNILFWNKGMQPPTQYYMKCGEFILLFRKGKARYINNIGSKTLININGLKGKEKKHPTEKPVELLEYLILNSSDEGDTILDCFLGSGSTGVASVNTNRNFIGIELDNTYFETCKNRINNHIITNNLKDINVEIAE